MSASKQSGRLQVLRRPGARIVAATAAVAVVAATMAAGTEAASAATTPYAQSVGRFVDGAVGSTTLESIANVEDASAMNPGTVTDQNPLNVKLLNTLDLPLTGALQLPGLLGITLGAANQVAVAKSDGYSYGASGAVSNSGGVSVGGNNAAYPAGATINLDASSLAGNTGSLGGSTGAELGGVEIKLGAVSALAATPAGVGKAATTDYQIAGLTIQAGSPLLGSLLGTVVTPLSPLLAALVKAAGQALPSGCSLLSGGLPTLSLDGGAITLDPTTGELTIDLAKFLQTLGLNLNSLPANTDLLADLLNYITSADGLAKGLESAINGLINPLESAFSACSAALTSALGPVGGLLTTVLGVLTSGQTTLENTINGLVSSITSAAGSDPLKPLASLLGKLVDIGVNVQPNGAKGSYTDPLKATASQDTAPVAGQTVVRAIELNLLGTINLALANAAAGPSNPKVPTAPSTGNTTSTVIPTGVPAGSGTTGGDPALPLVLLIIGLVVAGGGVMAYRLRLGRHSA